MMLTEVSREEQTKWRGWWRDHLDDLKKRGVVTEDGYRSALMWVASPEQIGYGQGQIRPGELGKWDVFYELEMCGVPYTERLLLSGLSDAEVQAVEKRERMEDRGYDPNNPEEVAEFDLVECMTPEERDAYLSGQIDSFEAVLGREDACPSHEESKATYPGRYLEGQASALRTISNIVEEGMAEEARAGWIEDDLRRSQERQARAEKPKIRKCRRCKHPFGSHAERCCTSSTKKGETCGCPKLLE